MSSGPGAPARWTIRFGERHVLAYTKSWRSAAATKWRTSALFCSMDIGCTSLSVCHLDGCTASGCGCSEHTPTKASEHRAIKLFFWLSGTERESYPAKQQK